MTNVVPFSFTLAQELLSVYGSPLYVYDGDSLGDTLSHYRKSIPYYHTKCQFATVTNGNIELLKIFQSFNWGLHANTPGDVYLGLKAGFVPEAIVYSGSNLNATEMEQILSWGVRTLNLDSISQLELCCQIYQHLKQEVGVQVVLPESLELGQGLHPEPIKIGLRLNLPELTGESRIGVRPVEFPIAIEIAKAVGLKIGGLHFYRGTGTKATTAFTQAIDTLMKTGQLLPDWQYLDFGGGFGYPYRREGIAFDWQIFGKAITEALGKLDRNIELIIEPGRAVIAGCGTLLASVVSVKWQGNKQIIGVDTTVANLSVPSVHGGYREIVTWKEEKDNKLCLSNSQTLRGTLRTSSPIIRGQEGATYLTDVCGNTTYSRDYLGKNCQLPALDIGDTIAILDVGAYGYAMSSHFLHRPRPAEVLIEKGQHRLIRRREDYSVLLNHQVIT